MAHAAEGLVADIGPDHDTNATLRSPLSRENHGGTLTHAVWIANNPVGNPRRRSGSGEEEPSGATRTAIRAALGRD
jgi:hypothetical protein